MHVEQVQPHRALDDLKERYLLQTTAPLDGMWLHAFVPAARHYAWREGNELRGYFCVNEDDYLLQFFVHPRHRDDEMAFFEHAVVRGESAAGPLNGAYVSTAEPHSLSLYLDHFSTFEVDALMYQLDDPREAFSASEREPVSLTQLEASQLPDAVDFADAEIGAPRDWVAGYFANLIERGELYGVSSKDQLIATGENRLRLELSDPHADLGVVVAQSHRGRGLATRILSALVSMNDRAGVKSICSTERENKAAQKAIARAGFVAHNRIVRFDA